ncbi:MAG: PilN domain-containing protein [Candidatus Saccharimonadaceae bacterium]
MINLLPTQAKKEILAGRSNVLLVRYIWATVALLVLLGVLSLLSYLLLQKTKADLETTIRENEEQSIDYTQVRAKSDQFKANLATAKSILDKRVNYTRIILDISKRLPKGVVLDSLNLDTASFGKPMDIVGRATDYRAALALKNSLQASDIMTDVKFKSLASLTDGGKYGLSVTMEVTIKTELANE